jgi:chorismate dehydratase
MLFSNHGWKDLDGKTIGITDDTATSVQLLNVLLRKKYGVHAILQRMHSGVNDFDQFDAVLLIGDDALRANRFGLAGFELCYDLATEWYEWKNLPFVFAVWAVRKSLQDSLRTELNDIIRLALESCENILEIVGEVHGKRIGLSMEEAGEYLRCFTYKLGERERMAIETFQSLFLAVELELT